MNTTIGIAWYSESQWPDYQRVMVDEVDEAYVEWKKKAERTLQSLKQKGQAIKKVPVDVLEFELWCRAAKRKCDGPARAAYVSHLLQKEKKPNQAPEPTAPSGRGSS